ncbi:unnamed protein product [Boreogadus saida]
MGFRRTRKSQLHHHLHMPAAATDRSGCHSAGRAPRLGVPDPRSSRARQVLSAVDRGAVDGKEAPLSWELCGVTANVQQRQHREQQSEGGQKRHGQTNTSQHDDGDVEQRLGDSRARLILDILW